MKNPLRLLLVAALVTFGSGCSLTEKYNKNSAAGAAWLKANDKGPSRANLEGVYYSPDWGTVVINQRDNKLTGAIAQYQVTGISTGKSAYLLLADDGWIENTMVLTRKNSEILEGAYSPSIPFSDQDKLPIHLEKIVQ
jgi:hypothetical protein